MASLKHGLSQTSRKCTNALMNVRFKCHDGSFGKVRVDVTSSGTMVKVIHRRGDRARDREACHGGRVLLNLAGAAGVDLLIVAWISDVNLTRVDADDGAYVKKKSVCEFFSLLMCLTNRRSHATL